MPINSHVGVKGMGKLDSKPFHAAMKRKYNDAEADERASELCSLWEEYLRDPEWHPIKVVNINGNYQVSSESIFIEVNVFVNMTMLTIVNCI